jgi:uncharacterized Tic20 family protein
MPVEYPLSTPTSDERTLAILAHILPILFGFGILAPLIIYLVRKDDSSFVKENAREALNFQITMIICFIIAAILTAIVIGIFLLMALGIIDVVLAVIAAVRVSENKIYRYPFNLRLIK